MQQSLPADEVARKFYLITNMQDCLKDIFPEHYKLVFTAGVYVIDDPTIKITSMLDKANIARKSMKGNHTSIIVAYTADMNKKAKWEKEITISMENALTNHEFVMYLQPKYSLKSQRIISAEALVRWNHPKKGLMPPGVFIPLFEQNGFIQKVDMYMFEQVCVLLSEWEAKGINIMPSSISVNLSRLHLSNSNLIENLIGLTQKYRISPNHIELELTESIVFDNTNKLVEIMGSLKKAGFQISIDDFGSGYSSLNLLKDLPVDIIKIDKGFLEQAGDSSKGQSIISSVIDMTRKLKLITVAEGVETREQLDLLTDMGCDIVQGYYYARPMSIVEFEQRYILEQKENMQSTNNDVF